MKNILFFLAFFILSIFLNASNPKREAIQAITNYDTFIKYLLHHACDGTSGIGGTCSATCPDACGCQCSSSFWTCTCNCSCGGNQTFINQTIDPGPKANWRLIKSIIQKEKTEVATRLAKKVMSLYHLGVANKIKDYNELASEMEKDLNRLDPKTLREIASALS